MQEIRANKKYLFWILYIPAYFISFFLLEKRTDVEFNYIHCSIDDQIPFIDYFIVPYLLWFLYIGISVFLFFLWNKEEFQRLAIYLALGMTTFIIVSYVYPNALTLRPDAMPDHGIFTDLVQKLYTTDTSTNVLPSIHVYNTICVTVAVFMSKIAKKHKLLAVFCIVLSILIILSTMFLKQHSIIDVIAAFIMAVIYFIPSYLIKWKKANSAN